MRSYLVLAGVSAVVAVNPLANPIPTDPLIEILEHLPTPTGNIEKRGTRECMSVATSMLPEITNIPTPDASLSSFISEQTQWSTITDPCVIPEATGSMTSEYSSWASGLQSWYSDQQDGISSLIKACSDVPEVSRQVSSLAGDATLCKSMYFASETGAAQSNGDAGDDDGESAANGSSAKVALVAAAAIFAGLLAL